MDALLRDVVGFVSEYKIEIVLWIAVLAGTAAAWYMLWPLDQWVVAGAITVVALGAVASAQSSIVTSLKKGRSQRKRK